jgi:hypothetical protein
VALEQVTWAAGAGDDLHLLPGLQSPQLDQLLTIIAGGVPARGDRPPAGVTVAWTQSFVPGAAGTGGVVVDPGTGLVTVGGPLPAPPRLLDFLVIATVTEAATGTSLQAYLRVHLHTALLRLWLTPSTLTVRVGARGVRFSVLAEFDDGSYGDITNWSPRTNPAGVDLLAVREIATGSAVTSWSSNTPADLDVDPKTGELDCSRSAANVTITLRTSTPAAVATANAVGADGWLTPATVQKVDGPGFAAMANVPNVLIIGDGFAAAEGPTFETLTNRLIAEVHANRRLTPYGLLKDQMNFFRVMLPSRETGVSVWNPIDRATVGPETLASDVDVSVAPAAAPTLATIAAPTPNVSRFLLNERDTAFGMTFGERPRAQRFNQMRGIHRSDRRLSEDDLDDFLGALIDPGGNPVGLEWIRNGKDEELLVVLARTSRYGGANNFRASSGRMICVGLGNNQAHRIDVPASGIGHDIKPDAIPGAPHLVTQLTIVHELAHTFNLGDEYGSPAGGPVRGAIPSGHERDLANGKANLQTRDTLIDLNGNFDPTLTKWSGWPRIRKAGVLTAAPGPIAGGYRLQLGAGHATPFAQGDVVRLRTRPLPGSVQSDHLEVMAPPATNAELTVRPLGAFNPGAFAAGSIVLAPVLDAFGDDLSLVHASVIGHMVTTQNPLNAASRAGQNRPCPPPRPPPPPLPPGPLDEPVYPYSTPSLSYGPGNAPNPPKESAWITGLWERGRGYDCEIYHPTGACLMNVFTYDIAGVKSFQFCWVCRYALVDAIDPTKHGDVDRAIRYRYPT